MIALVKHLDGTMRIAEQQLIGKLPVWKTNDGIIWLQSWIQSLEILDMTMNKVRQVYPEYFV